MAKLINKETKVIKEIKKEFEASMYLGTGEWELLEENDSKITKTPIINTNNKEEK